MGKVVQFPQSTPAKFGYHKARVKKGRKKINLEDYGQLNIFSENTPVISLRPNLAPFEEALQYDERKQSALAIESYKKAIGARDNVADAYCNLGILYSENGESAMAIDTFTNCLKNEPRHFEAHYNLANLFSEIGNLSLAKVHYQMSVTINPEFSNGYYNLGLILALNREFEEAVDAFLKYKDTAPINERANALALIKSLKESIAN
ncbi:MAG: tetratricopeptide repeat protein [Bacteroidetes bacterium]|nr:tetratricopeptide repeat protein [Bacteroidota bacterium]MDA1121576.1 tetratricopeptide repeat protein [Bacteroidota bacterium]